MLPEIHLFDSIIIYVYGLCIVIGGYLTVSYVAFYGKKELNIAREKIIYGAFIVCLAAFIGGKFFFFLENPKLYFGKPLNMLGSLNSGFVFFGSSIFAIPTMLWYFKRNNWPVLQMFDIMAFVGIITQLFGRLGCLMAGCCYGIPTEGWMGIVFSNPKSAAPLNIHLHPTQLYEITLIGSIGIFLFWFKDRKRFHGEVWFLYLILYSSGRIFTDMYRGDLEKSYIVQNILSHSQLISIIFIIITVVLYYLFNAKKRFSV